MKRTISILLSLVLGMLVAGASSAIGNAIESNDLSGYDIWLQSRHTVGVHLIGTAFRDADGDYTRGTSFVGELYGCDSSDPDTDDDDVLSDESECTLITALSGSNVFNASTRKLWYVLVVTTPEAAGSDSHIGIKGSVGIAKGGGGGGILGWPSLEALGGSGRPTQALIVETLNLHQRLNGPGRDDNASVFVGCNADDVSDFSCIGSLGVTDSSTLSIGGNSGQFASSIVGDIAADAEWRWLCRDGTTFVHEKGTSGDVNVATSEGDMMPMTLLDESEGVYRTLGMSTAGMDCVNETGNLNAHAVVAFPTTTSDTIQHMVTDGVHFGPYGARWYAQRMLQTAWMDQYPEVLGLENLIPDGYFESTCGAMTAVPAAGGSGVLGVDNTAQINDPMVGSACRWTTLTDPTDLTTATVTANAGEYYVGSAMLNFNAIGAADRSATLRVRDNSGANISNVVFWIDGHPTGGVVELASATDSSGTGTAGEYNMIERMCYGGCTIKFAFRMEAGDTGFDIQLEITDTYNTIVDELWVRKKVFPDLSRHPIIADGKATIQVFTDSRGAGGAYERLPRAIEYMLGMETRNGDQRTTIRPNLYVDPPPTHNAFSVSGSRLGDYVGMNDGNLDWDGVAIATKIEDSVDSGVNYCVALYGINDQLGGNSRPGFGANATPADTEVEKFFGDQLRGFEMAAEKNGCIPIVLMDHMGRVDTTATDCHDEDGGAINCGTWHNENWVQVLHGGID